MAKQDKPFESQFDDNDKTRRNLQSFSVDINKFTDNVVKSVDRITKLAGTRMFDPSTVKADIDAMRNRGKELDEFLKTSKSSYDKIKKVQDDYAKNTKLVTDKIKQLNRAILQDVSRKFVTYTSDIETSMDSLKSTIGTSKFKTDNIEEYLGRIEELKSTLEDLASSEDLSAQELDMLNTHLDAMDTALSSVNEKMQESIKMNDSFSESASGIAEEITGIYGSVSGLIEKIPLIGTSLASALNISGLGKQLQTQVGDILGKSMGTSGMISSAALTKSFTLTFKAMFSLIGSAMKTLFLNPMVLGIAATVGLVYGMWKIFSSMEKTSSDVAQAMGVGNANTKELSHHLKTGEANLINMGSSLESAIESASALNVALGNTNFVTVNASTAMAKMSDWTGATKETMAAVYSQMLGIQGATEKSAIASTQQLAAVANLSGIAPNALFKDIESNSELIATHLSETPGALNKAIMSTRKLGLSLSQVDSIIESTMDFESSIEKEFKASVLLGKQLNFNSARQKIFNNDVAGGIQDIMNQVGSLQDFNNMNMFQKKALADTLGMSAGELQKSLQYQSMLSKMYPDNVAKQQKILDMLEGRTPLDEQSLKNQISYQSAIDDIKNSFSSLFSIIKEALIPAGESFFGFINKPETKIMIKDMVTGLGQAAAALVSIVGLFSKAGILGLALLGTITMMIPKLITMAAIKVVSGSPLASGMDQYGGRFAAGVATTAIGSAIGGGGMGATVGGLVGSGIGALGFLIPGAGPAVGYGLMALGSGIGGYLGGQFDKPVKDGILRGNTMYPISNEDDVMALKSGGPIGNALSNKEAGSSESIKVLSDKLDKIATLLSQLKIDVMLDGKKVGYGIAKSQLLPRGGY